MARYRTRQAVEGLSARATLPAISALVPHQPSVGKAMLTLYDLGERISSVWPKFRFKKKEGIIEKISYERRVYESVDDKSAAPMSR